MGERAEEKRITREELINLLQDLNKDQNYQKKRSSYRKKEAEFLVYAIFQAPLETSVFQYLGDELMRATGTNLTGGDLKKIKFLYNLIEANFNGTKACILSGYSPNRANRRAYELRQEIRRFNKESDL